MKKLKTHSSSSRKTQPTRTVNSTKIMFSNKMFLTTLSCLVYLSLQRSSSHKTGDCATRDTSNSIKACWTYTKQLLPADMEKTDEKFTPCFGFNLDVSKHQLGVEVMKTSHVIYCFAMAKEGLELPSIKSLDIDTVGFQIFPCLSFSQMSSSQAFVYQLLIGHITSFQTNFKIYNNCQQKLVSTRPKNTIKLV